MCFAAQDVVDICSSASTSSSRTLFLSSPGYPQDTREDVQCACNASTSDSRKLLLTFADFQIRWSERCRNARLQMADGKNRLIKI